MIASLRWVGALVGTTWRDVSPRAGIRRSPLVMLTALIASLPAVALIVGLPTRPLVALPLYARQTGQPCAACHTAFPELTPFGRRFKLGGYTMGGGDSSLPIAVMLQPTFTRTEVGQPGGAAPHFGPNNNFAMQEVSLFTGGRITDNIGAFVQGTYSGIDRRFAVDNTDIRFAHSAKVEGHDLLWGLTLHNNPTVQDVWNTTPVWRFPFISSDLAPAPAASTFIEGAFSQRVVGLGSYALVDDLLYLEASGYRTLSKHTQLALGTDPSEGSAIDGVAPYWRVALEPNFGKHSLQVGAFGMHSDIVPLRMRGAGTDSFTDFGLDSQYQYIDEAHTFTLRSAVIQEDRNLRASEVLGLADNTRNNLTSLRISATYIYDSTWSITGERFQIHGSPDATLYGTANGSPNSSGWTAELAYLPFMRGGPSFWPWLNARVGLQYTFYDKFNGASTNFDGNGRNAHNNNTLFLYTWLMF